MSSTKFYVGDIVYFRPVNKCEQVYFMRISHLTNRVAEMVPMGVLYNPEDHTTVPNLGKFKNMGFRALDSKPYTGWRDVVEGSVSESRCKININSYHYEEEEVHLWDGTPVKLKK